MRNSTLLFLIKKSTDKADNTGVAKITDICLAMKKRGFGMGRWNGSGGKCNQDESIENATIRETYEEVGVKVSADNNYADLHKVAELTFNFANKSEWDQLVHVYFAEKWQGEPVESEEMRPEWFSINNIPFKNMWPDDPLWLPKVIDGDFVKAMFRFGDGDVILEQKVDVLK